MPKIEIAETLQQKPKVNDGTTVLYECKAVFTAKDFPDGYVVQHIQRDMKVTVEKHDYRIQHEDYFELWEVCNGVVYPFHVSGNTYAMPAGTLVQGQDTSFARVNNEQTMTFRKAGFAFAKAEYEARQANVTVDESVKKLKPALHDVFIVKAPSIPAATDNFSGTWKIQGKVWLFPGRKHAWLDEFFKQGAMRGLSGAWMLVSLAGTKIKEPTNVPLALTRQKAGSLTYDKQKKFDGSDGRWVFGSYNFTGAGAKLEMPPRW